MKNLSIKGLLIALLIPFSMAISANAQAYQNCEIKKQKLQQQLNEAKRYGNTNRVRGLERAIENVERNCYVPSQQPSTKPVPSTSSTKNTGCERKKAALREQLQYAKAHNNHNRVRGLEQALANIDRYCTTDSLKEDLQDDIEDLIEEIIDLEEEIQEARLKGKSDKIAKKERKLARVLEELADKQAELSRF